MKKSLPKNFDKEDKGPKTDFDQKFLDAVGRAKKISGIKSDRAMSIELGRHTDFINRVRNGFQSATPEAWDALLAKFPETTATNNQNQNSGIAIGTNHGTATQQHALGDCEKERDLLRQEVDSLRAQLAMKDTVIAAKDETIDLLRIAFNRPN